MPKSISTDLIEEANEQLSDSAWLTLLKITTSDSSVYHYVKNTEDITYNGDTYTALPFSIESVSETTDGSLPTFAISISNVDYMIQSIIEQDAPNFGSGWDVEVMIVNSSYLDTVTPDLHQKYKTISVTCDANNCSFNIGMANPVRMLFPSVSYSPNFCQRTFKDVSTGCDYAGGDVECGKRLNDCKEKFPERLNLTDKYTETPQYVGSLSFVGDLVVGVTYEAGMFARGADGSILKCQTPPPVPGDAEYLTYQTNMNIMNYEAGGYWLILRGLPYLGFPGIPRRAIYV